MSKDSTLFKFGDMVRLKSGGPPMTVVQLLVVDLPDLPGEFGCTWFEGKRLKQRSFPAEALESANDRHIEVVFVKPSAKEDHARPPLKLEFDSED